MKSKQTPEVISRIIRYAREDRTSFEEIEKRTGLRESEVMAEISFFIPSALTVDFTSFWTHRLPVPGTHLDCPC